MGEKPARCAPLRAAGCKPRSAQRPTDFGNALLGVQRRWTASSVICTAVMRMLCRLINKSAHRSLLFAPRRWPLVCAAVWNQDDRRRLARLGLVEHWSCAFPRSPKLGSRSLRRKRLDWPSVSPRWARVGPDPSHRKHDRRTLANGRITGQRSVLRRTAQVGSKRAEDGHRPDLEALCGSNTRVCASHSPLAECLVE
jgi:hypothetical protein